jgi:glycosyltransferase involved in cell wall biosynthesis
VIFEPGLRGFAGHRFENVRIWSHAARAQGLLVVGFFNAAAGSSLDQLGIESVRHFSSAPAPTPRRITGVGGLATSLLGKSAVLQMRHALFGGPRSDEEAYVESERASASRFGDQLDAALARVDWRPGDVAFFPTLSWAEAAEVAIRTQSGTAKAAAIHICLRFDPPDATAALDVLRAAAQANPAVCWISDTFELANAYAEILRRPVAITWIPLEHAAIEHGCSRRRRPPPVRMVYLGESRMEKGFHLLPAAIEHAQATLGERVTTTIQVLFTDHDRSPEIADAAQRILGLARSEDVVLEGEVSSDAFVDALCNAHVLLLPYLGSAYTRRSSGLLAAGIAAGLSIVAPGTSSWLTKTIEEEGARERAFFFEEGGLSFASAAAAACVNALQREIWTAMRPRCSIEGRAPWEAI